MYINVPNSLENKAFACCEWQKVVAFLHWVRHLRGQRWVKTFWSLNPSKFCLKHKRMCLYIAALFETKCALIGVCWETCSEPTQLFRANTTGWLPSMFVLKVCLQLTWLKLLNRKVDRFRANTARRVGAERHSQTFLGPANMVNMQTFLADFGTCCSAKTFFTFDWSPTWHFKAIDLTFILPKSNYDKSRHSFIVQDLRP